MEQAGEGTKAAETDQPAIVIPSSDGERYYPGTTWTDAEAQHAERRVLEVIRDLELAAAR